MDKVNLINLVIAIFSSAAALGLYAALRVAIKELKDVRNEYIKNNADGVWTDSEKASFLNEVMEAILALDKVWKIIQKIWKKNKAK